MLPTVVRRPYMLMFLMSLSVQLGCSGGSAKGPKAPELSPDEAGAIALADYDSNKDGGLDAKELEKCPALREAKPEGGFIALKSVDRDNNGQITAEEIAARLRHYQERPVAVVNIACQVMLDNNAVVGATVTFTPEKFMGPNVRAATGVSDEAGNVELQMEGGGVPGLHCGFYRVAVSKKDAQGKETIPARFNTNTTLGFEVAPDTREDNFLIRISRR